VSAIRYNVQTAASTLESRSAKVSILSECN